MNEEAISCLDIYLKVQLTSGIESLTEMNCSEHLGPSLDALYAYTKQSCYYVWFPFVIEEYQNVFVKLQNKCASLEDQNMAMFQTIHKLCTLRRGLSADLIESAVVNLVICIVDKKGKGLYTW